MYSAKFGQATRKDPTSGLGKRPIADIALGLFLALILLSTGCASTHRTKILSSMAIAGAVGVAIGISKQNEKEANAALYGSAGAAGAALLGHMIWNTDREEARLRLENEVLSEELQKARGPKTVTEAPGLFSAKIPDRYRRLVSPGAWRVSEIDQWVEDGENRLIHQDKIMELTPPQLNPGSAR